jgi:dipeptidyl-peptidase 9
LVTNGGRGSLVNTSQLRIFFLSVEEPGRELTLFTANIPSGGQDFNGSLQWNRVIDSTGFPQQPFQASKEELLMSERKRCSFWGINSYELSGKTGRIIFPANGTLFQTSACGSVGFKEIPSSFVSARLNATMAPSNPDLIAFCSRGNIWVFNCESSCELQLTTCDTSKSITAGVPSYIMQEEFNRYTGFWWNPVTDGKCQYLLYEEVDESEVERISISSAQEGAPEEHRFPKVGKENARSSIKVVRFTNTGQDPRVMHMNFDLKEYFPWCEYIVRLCWTPNGNR